MNQIIEIKIKGLWAINRRKEGKISKTRNWIEGKLWKINYWVNLLSIPNNIKYY